MTKSNVVFNFNNIRNMDSKTRIIARNMAWERCKGELNSIMHTFVVSERSKFRAFKKTCQELTERVERGRLLE